LFRRAVKLQPDFVDAHASLALAYVALFSNGERRDTIAPARDEISTTLRLDPSNFTALLSDAQLKALA
jgi:cytochrome c-type biogenesis protein CcmH/NrfG